ncbi:MAG: hypothetical protein U0904_12565, partial [Candidatus Nanopelagicales bacterium]|nr:hypothetical protein [Candidatus Nanopelagicales bacterium]
IKDPDGTRSKVWEGATGAISAAWGRGDYGEAVGRVTAIAASLAIPGAGGAGVLGKIGSTLTRASGRLSALGSRSTLSGLRDALLGARQAYVSAARSIPQEGFRRIAAGESSESAARWAVDARNALKVSAREGLPGPLRALAEWRSRIKYGDPVGPSYEKMMSKPGMTNERVIERAGSTNDWIDRLLGAP